VLLTLPRFLKSPVFRRLYSRHGSVTLDQAFNLYRHPSRRCAEIGRRFVPREVPAEQDSLECQK